MNTRKASDPRPPPWMPTYLELVIRAQAMGLVEGEKWWSAEPELLLNELSRAGLAVGWRAGRYDAALGPAVEALEASPNPSSEWAAVEAVLGRELVAELVGVSGSSLRRYGSGQRDTPDEVAARLHLVAMIIGDLAGSYNHFGIRRWFRRRRQALADRAPADVLTGEWDPDQAGPAAVRGLSRRLIDFAAT